MKKVFKFVKGKRDEKKDGGGSSQTQFGELISPIQTPEDERFIGLDYDGGYVADFSGKDKTLTKLHKAAWQGNLEKLKSALKKVEVDSVDKRNRTALHFAVVRGHPNIVWFLLGSNAKTGICDDEGRTPLLKAIECGHKECITLLLERGSDCNVSDYAGNTGLHLAANLGSLDIVSMLLKKGANAEISNNAGDYPLHIATKMENKELVELFLSFKVSVDVLDRENRTSLMLASKAGNVSLVQIFLERGAQLSTVDSNGWTSQDYALLGGFENIVTMLKNSAKIEAENKKNREDSLKRDGESERRNEYRMEIYDKDFFEKKIKSIFEKCSREESELLEKQKKEETPESPTADVMPPICQPPKSWEMIQAGMIDQNQKGVESKRRSITTLGTLRSRRESFAESLGGASPKHTLSLNRRRHDKVSNSFAKQRFSFNEEYSLERWLADARALEASTETLSDLESSPRNPSESEEESKDEACSSEEESEEKNSTTDSKELLSDGTLGRFETMCQREEIWVANPYVNSSRGYEGGLHLANDQNCECYEKTETFPPPPSALELGVDMARSIKYMKGISEDGPLGSVTEKNIWRKDRESYSVDGTEGKGLTEGNKWTGEPALKGNSSKACDSEHKLEKVWSRPSDVSRRINEQLECYDQALRELAESTSAHKISGPHEYYSLPSSKSKDFEGSKRTNSLTRGQELMHLENRGSEFGEREKTSAVAASKGEPLPSETAKKLEKEKKREMLLAMREVKDVRVSNSSKNSFEDQILSPLEKRETDSESGGKLEQVSNDMTVPSAPKPLEENMTERRKSSSSSTGDEPTLWLQDDLRRKTQNTPKLHDSGEDVSELLDEDGTKDERPPSFSPLGVVYREIQKECQGEDKTAFGRLRPDFPESEFCTSDRSIEGNVPKETNEEEEEVVREQSPDVSLSSGPIEPLGAERDSGSEPESSHNDLTPVRNYSLKTQHEWLKTHLKRTTSEKSKLEQVTARLSEKTERLQYELADAKEAAQSRDEVIRLLQDQLTRMEAAYTKSLEESVQSRLQLTSHEQEILHLKELCYKYEEEKEVPSKDIENLELKIKTLEEDKEKLKEEIFILEQEKSSLEEQLKAMKKGEKESGEQEEQWKERLKDSKNCAGFDEAEILKKALQESNCIDEITAGNCEWKRKYLEVNKENIELKSKIKSLTSEINGEEVKEKESKASWIELTNKNMEMELNFKKLKSEMEERIENLMKKKEEELRLVTSQFFSEQQPSAVFQERKLMVLDSDGAPKQPGGEIPESQAPPPSEGFHFTANNFTHLLERRSPETGSSHPEAGASKEVAPDEQEPKANRRRATERKDELAWSNLYGMKRFARAGTPTLSIHREEEANKLRERYLLPKTEKEFSVPNLEFLNLKKELMRLKMRMAEEKDLRRLLESQIAEINSDLSEKQNLERELYILKRKINKDCVRKFEEDLLRHQKDLESKRKEQSKEREEENSVSDYRNKCKILAKERQKSKEIKNRSWKKSKSFDWTTAPPFSTPVLDLHSWTPSKPESISFSGLASEMKTELDRELDRSIKKHAKDASSFQSIPT